VPPIAIAAKSSETTSGIVSDDDCAASDLSNRIAMHIAKDKKVL
jgi:hypothetical protein